MKDWYFYQERGRTVGPVSLEDLKARIGEGRIRLFDLVYRDGDSGWKMAMENAELRGEFKTFSVDSLRDRPWVVLQKKTSVAMDFITLGPYSEKEVRESILAGRVGYSDYIWREGFHQWRRIASLEEFNPRAQTGPEVKVPPTTQPEVARAELLNSVVEMKRGRAVRVEPRPPEAEGRDLAKGIVPAEPEVRPQVAAPQLPEEAAPEEIQPLVVAVKSTGRPLWIDWVIVGALALAVTGTCVVVYRRATEPPAGPPPTPAPVEPAVKVPEKVAVKEPAPAAPSEPTQLTLNVDVKGRAAHFEIRSNGSADYPVYIQIVGLPGQVSEGASYYRYLKMSPAGGAPLDLSGVKLPMGKFILRAETGDLTKESRFSLGTTDPQYRSAVSRRRKQYARDIWRERLQLFRLAKKLEKELDGGLNGKKFKSTGFEALQDVKRGNHAGLILFTDWYELKQIYSEAREKPSEALFDRARRARARLAAFSVWK